MGIYRKGGAGEGLKGRWNLNGKCINSRVKWGFPFLLNAQGR
jgi:hypothetical protein